MIRKAGFATLAIVGCVTAAQAADNRIRTQVYDANAIVKILGKAGIQSTIEFADDERIENVAVGDSSAWQITPNRRASLLFVKPLSAHSRTNMTVVTDKRTYMFDLVSGEKSAAPVYALKFSYPNDKPAGGATLPLQQAAAAPQQTATMTADKLHFDWNTKGNGKLLPSRVFDDGASLYLAWSKDTPLPAILTLSEDRKEGPINYRMSGEYIVITPIPSNLVLRYGNKFAQLWPGRRIAPVPAAMPTAAVGQLAAVSTPPPINQVSQPKFSQAAPAATNPPASSVKFANMTALYSDQLTDDAHEH
jgi:type IV secretion system protein VirB9